MIIEDREVRLKAGTMMFLAPFVRHGDIAGSVARHDALGIKFELKGDWVRLPAMLPVQKCFHIPQFETIVTEWQSRDELRQVGAQMDLARLILRMACDPRYHHANKTGPTAAVSANPVWLSDVLKYTWEHVGDKLTVQDLARRVHMQEDYFSRSFRNLMGFTPSYYLQRIKSEKARELLSRGATCKETATALGFSSPAHFAHLFRRFARCSATEWARRHADHPAPATQDVSSGQFFA